MSMPQGPEDATRLLADAKNGSIEALGEALEACRFYLVMAADRELDADLRAKGGASDLVQETFLEAQRDFAQFRGATPAELLAWLRQLLKNNIANFQRHYRGTAKRRASLEVPQAAASGADAADGLIDGGPTPSHIVMAEEQDAELRRAMDSLPDDQRRVLTLRYIENRSFEEIGQILGRTSNAARKLWGRAVESLQDILDGVR